MELPSRVEVAIVGAGAAGLAVAVELSRRGLTVAVLEKGAAGDPGTSALGASPGLVAVQARTHASPGPLRDVALLSRHLWPEWVSSIEEDAGTSCEYDVRGALAVALSDAEEVHLDRALDWQRERSLPFEVLPSEEALERESALAPLVQSAFAFPLDGLVAPERLARALVLAARANGARVVERVPVTAIRLDAGQVRGVETAAGLVVAEVVVVAAGAGSSHLGGVPLLPVAPRRTVVVALDASADPDRLGRAVVAPGVALLPRRDGTLVAASEAPGTSLDTRPSAEEVAALLGQAGRLVPAAARYPLQRAWVEVSGGSPDGVPLVGETGTPGLFAATGLGRDGVLLAPAVGVVCADLVTGETPPFPPASLSPARFGSREGAC